MISSQELRKAARERHLALDLLEKDYVLGWLLYGVATSSVSMSLAFKGGTSLSKVYFPGQWRLSEDLDFTVLDDSGLNAIAKSLQEEVPKLVGKKSGISVILRSEPFANSSYLQSRFQYVGPITKNTVRVEVSKEGFIGDISTKDVPQFFDYPRFSVRVYTLLNVLAEKVRTLLERGKVKDYYDVWKLLKTQKFSGKALKEAFLRKCETKGVKFTGVDQFFPPNVVEVLTPHVKMGLTRLTSESLPPLETMILELKTDMSKLLA